jgi:crossover junction endodeoxyribonuclease RusA
VFVFSGALAAEGEEMNELTFPWPQRVLSPNARCHWAVKAKSAKAYRYECFVLASIGLEGRVDNGGPIDVYLTFRPPSKRRYDLDNALASLKSGLDGLADALKVNDSRFRLHAVMGTPKPPGAVFVTIGRA